jgi:hypothetical protein
MYFELKFLEIQDLI